MAEKLGQEWDVIEEGLGGRTCVFDDPIMESMNGLKDIRNSLMSHKTVDLLIVMLGTNDVKERFSATPENVAKGLARLLEKAIQTNAWTRNVPKILVVCPPPISPIYRERFLAEEMEKECDIKSKRLSPLYQEIAVSLGLDFLDAGTLVHPCNGDGIHLDAEAHWILGTGIAKKVEEIFNQNDMKNGDTAL